MLYSIRCLIITGMCLLPVLAGCGGTGLSQADMKRMAMKRPSDDDDEDSSSPPPANAPPRQPAAGAGPAPTANNSNTSAAPADNRSAASRPPAAPGNSKPAAKVDAKEFELELPEGVTRFAGESDVEKRQQSIDNLTTIGKAVSQYLEEKGSYPSDIKSPNGRPLLSWRVRLLPYLGYQQLYDAFDTESPWNDPHNLELMKHIPPIYQSPDRMDEKTNYVAPRRYNSIVDQRKGAHSRMLEDGDRHTVFVFEVDDSWAVPWIEPRGYEIQISGPKAGLGNLRNKVFYVLWADGTLSAIANSINSKQILAMTSIDNGEPFHRSDVAFPASAEDQVSKVESPGTNTTAALAEETVEAVEAQSEQAYSGPPVPQRLPVPAETEQRAKQSLLRDAYATKIAEAKSRRERRDLAQELLNDAQDLGDDPTGRYVMYHAVIRIAEEAQAGDLVLDAHEEILNEFDVDDVVSTVAILKKLSSIGRNKDLNQRVADLAEPLIRQCILRDLYEDALEMQQLTYAARRSEGTEEELSKLQDLRREIRVKKSAFAELKRALAQLGQQPDNPEANLLAGRYYCFTKEMWERGLKMLSKSSDPKLAAISRQDLAAIAAASAEAQIECGDDWWDLATDYPDDEESMRSRALFWYREALPNLQQGLQRVKIEIRIKEFEELYQ